MFTVRSDVPEAVLLIARCYLLLLKKFRDLPSSTFSVEARKRNSGISMVTD